MAAADQRLNIVPMGPVRHGFGWTSIRRQRTLRRARRVQRRGHRIAYTRAPIFAEWSSDCEVIAEAPLIDHVSCPGRPNNGDAELHGRPQEQ